MHALRHKLQGKARVIGLIINFRKFPLTQHNLLKLRTVFYVCVGILLLYGTKHMHRRQQRDHGSEIQRFRLTQIRLQKEIADFRNTTIGYCLHGLQNLLREYLANIQILRHALVGQEQNVSTGWMSWWNGGKKGWILSSRHSLHPQMVGYLEKLQNGYPFVNTVYFDREKNKVGIFLNDDYYPYVSNDCNTLTNKSAVSAQYFKAVYNASCTQNVTKSLVPHPLSERMKSLDIGMPEGYEQLASLRSHKWTYIHLIEDAVVSGYGEVSAKNLSLYPYDCYQTYGYQYFHKTFDEVFTITGPLSKHFAQQVLEDLPRLAPYLPFLLHNPQIKVHVGQRSEFHTLLGLGPERLVTGTVEGKLMYMPAGLPCHTSDVLNTQLLSYYLRRNLPNGSRNRNKVILVRKAYSYKRFRYHNEILYMLKQEADMRGLQVIEFDDDPMPSLEEAQKMFNTAIMIVAPHGVSLTNLLFCQPGTVVIEALDKDDQGFADLSYASLSLALGLRYYAVYYDHKPMSELSAIDIRVPVREYLERLDHIRSGINQAF